MGSSFSKGIQGMFHPKYNQRYLFNFIALVDNWFDEFSISFLVNSFARTIPFQSLFTIEKKMTSQFLLGNLQILYTLPKVGHGSWYSEKLSVASFQNNNVKYKSKI